MVSRIRPNLEMGVGTGISFQGPVANTRTPAHQGVDQHGVAAEVVRHEEPVLVELQRPGRREWVILLP